MKDKTQNNMKFHIYYFMCILNLTLFSCNSAVESIENKTLTQIEDSTYVNAPTINKIGSIAGKFQGCGYNNAKNSNGIELSFPRERENNQINSILTFSGLPSNFKVYSASIDNAIATIINNERYILYDPKLLTSTDYSSDSYWASMSILAHEIGHHLSGHTINSKGSNHKDELEADKYSGFILYKLGASLNQSFTAMNLLGSEHSSLTHPSKSLRLKAISEGWYEASNQRYQGAIPPPPNDKAENFYEFTAPMIIHKDLIRDAEEFNSDMYKDQVFLYGIVTEVPEPKFSSVRIRIVKTTKEFVETFRNLDGEDWEIGISSVDWDGSNEMCHRCAFNFRALMVPGRRLKFAMVEGWPGCGTSAMGIWTLTYAKAIDKIE